MEEIIWRQHLDTVYDVSSVGTVRNREKGTFNKLTVNAPGYCVWNCCDDGLQTITYVHRAVALAFLPNPEGLPTVDHKNQNKTDNRVDNLRWASHTLQQRNKAVYGASGFKGVYKRGNRYVAQISINKQKVYIGSYATGEDANAAYVARCAQEE